MAFTTTRQDASHQSPAAEAAGLLANLAGGIAKTCNWFFANQQDANHWCAELEGDTILESETILLLAFLGKHDQPFAKRCAQTIADKQLPSGGWAMYPGGKLEVSQSVKAYFALKLTGHDPKSEPMQRAAKAIRAAGGADAVNSFTRFYLALLGEIPYSVCPAVPPELMMLPKWFPINIYKMSAWSRTIVVPLSIMWAYRPKIQLPESQGIKELFLKPATQWPPLRSPGLKGPVRFFSWENFFRQADRGLKLLEVTGLKPFRSIALAKAKKWMIRRFAESDGLGAIFPPIVWSLIALRCLGYSDDSPEVRQQHAELQKLVVEDEHATWLQPCLSPVWDTAISLRALAASGKTMDDAPVKSAVNWLMSKEVTKTGDWAVRVSAQPAGWFFEYNNQFYPDVDDTVMVMIAMHDLGQRPHAAEERATNSETRGTTIADACERARRWVLAMQNRDGGWGAFDKDNDSEFLCAVPFADHNAMIDPSTPDLTGRVLEALAVWGHRLNDPEVQRAIRYIRNTQESDGSWFGRWGVNYIYGTWQVLVGLQAIGVPLDDPMMVRGAEWLLKHQQANGGWGESADTYESPELRGQGPTTASQTAWALLGLMAAGHADHPATERGIQYLLETQNAEGTWDEDEFTGTGFPQVFYLKYHYYPIYFPLLALGKWRQARGISAESTESIHSQRNQPAASISSAAPR